MRADWAKWTLLLAAGYNLLWGAWVILFPNSIFSALEMDLPRYPGIWQCVGMIVGVYGIGYAIAAYDPMRHWPIVLVGFLGKIFGPIGFVKAVIMGEFPLGMFWMIVSNDLIWWAPFAMILWRAASSPESRHQVTMTGAAASS
ncbi:MAG: alkyl hydroperoxide reductase [Phycisphaerae bacterium]